MNLEKLRVISTRSRCSWRHALAAEVLIVDDGSRDNLKKVVENYVAHHSSPVIQLLSYGENRGKLRRPFWIARLKADIVAFVDSGLCVPFSFLIPESKRSKPAADFAIASRRLPGTRILHDSRYIDVLVQGLLGGGPIVNGRYGFGYPVWI